MFDIRSLTKSDYCYTYRQLVLDADEAEVGNYVQHTKSKFAVVTKSFTDQLNSEWLLRNYLAVKYIMAASILAGSSISARDRGILLGVPYFNYYTLLNCCRAFLLTTPDFKWTGEHTIKLNHEAILNNSITYLRRLKHDADVRWGTSLKRARERRELFSYRFPGTGLEILSGKDDEPEIVSDLARLIAELAMLNSECLDASLTKHAPGEFETPPLPDHVWASYYNAAGVSTRDSDDHYRFGKYLKGGWKATSLEVMASDGLVTDFFGAWVPDALEEDDNAFDPDEWMGHLLTI